jgi:hypothetical protein
MRQGVPFSPGTKFAGSVAKSGQLPRSLPRCHRPTALLHFGRGWGVRGVPRAKNPTPEILPGPRKGRRGKRFAERRREQSHFHTGPGALHQAPTKEQSSARRLFHFRFGAAARRSR